MMDVEDLGVELDDGDLVERRHGEGVPRSVDRSPAWKELEGLKLSNIVGKLG